MQRLDSPRNDFQDQFTAIKITTRLLHVNKNM